MADSILQRLAQKAQEKNGYFLLLQNVSAGDAQRIESWMKKNGLTGVPNYNPEWRSANVWVGSDRSKFDQAIQAERAREDAQRSRSDLPPPPPPPPGVLALAVGPGDGHSVAEIIQDAPPEIAQNIVGAVHIAKDGNNFRLSSEDPNIADAAERWVREQLEAGGHAVTGVKRKGNTIQINNPPQSLARTLSQALVDEQRQR